MLLYLRAVIDSGGRDTDDLCAAKPAGGQAPAERGGHNTWRALGESGKRALGRSRGRAGVYGAFPQEHWARIDSTNPLERLNREVKRRTEVVGVFPDTGSVLRLVGSVLIEQDDEWQVERRYFSQESMQRRKQAEAGGQTQGVAPRLEPIR
jgi:hypothetical protein